jgi:hypothetical protein
VILECVLLSASLCRAVHSKPIMVVAGVQTSALVADGVTSMNFRRHGFVEAEPVSRVFLGKYPGWLRMAPVGAAVVTGEVWLAYRMKTSRHAWERRAWWLPMVLGTAANTYEAIHNARMR